MESPIKYLRRLAGISQHQLAAIAGLNRNRISLVENGYARLKPETETKVLELLKAKIREVHKNAEHIVG